MARRHDLDWLRVILFGMLVPHHAAVGFVDWGADIYGFVNDRLAGPWLGLFIYFSHSWRLPALFVVAGFGAWFAFRHAAPPRAMGRRMLRLALPLAFGALVLNAAGRWAVAALTGEAPDFADFAARWWLAPEARQIQHLWFLWNLILYTLLAWPLVLAAGWLARVLPGPRALLLGCGAASIAVIALAMPHAAAIAGDGYQFPWYLVLFVAGILLGARHEAVLGWCARRAFWLLGCALAAFAFKIALLGAGFQRGTEQGAALAGGGWQAAGLGAELGGLGLAFALAKGLNAWLWVLAALGLAARFLNRDGPMLRALDAAIFPVYVLHFPLTLAGLAALTHTPWPWGLDFAVLVAGVSAGSAGLFLAFRALGWPVLLLGGWRARSPAR